MKLCKYCGNELAANSNPRREFCDDAHKMKYYRQQHQQDQSEALLAELEQLREQVSDQAQEIARLEHLLDVEKRYYQDTQAHTFKAWLRKQPPSPVAEKLTADTLVPVRGSRALYEAHVRRLHCTEEEHQDFIRLWKLMLLTRP
jgi:hypothetical protein